MWQRPTNFNYEAASTNLTHIDTPISTIFRKDETMTSFLCRRILTHTNVHKRTYFTCLCVYVLYRVQNCIIKRTRGVKPAFNDLET